MKDFFAAMYELFSSLYGDDLALHLYGFDGTDYTSNALYVSIGIYLLILSCLFTVLFYIILNKPNFSRWYHWLIVLFVNLIINVFIGYWLPYIDYDMGNIATSLADKININNIIGFSIVNGIWSVVWFVLFSVFCRLLCKFIPGIGYNTRDTPFPR